MAHSKEACREAVKDLVDLFKDLVFAINYHQKKPQLTPKTKLTFWGFDIDSETMTVSVTQDKKKLNS